jgi:hypothetical protein
MFWKKSWRDWVFDSSIEVGTEKTGPKKILQIYKRTRIRDNKPQYKTITIKLR